jgi:hypothetical protein
MGEIHSTAEGQHVIDHDHFVMHAARDGMASILVEVNAQRLEALAGVRLAIVAEHPMVVPANHVDLELRAPAEQVAEELAERQGRADEISRPTLGSRRRQSDA